MKRSTHGTGTRSTCTTGASITLSMKNWVMSMINDTMGISLGVPTGERRRARPAKRGNDHLVHAQLGSFFGLLISKTMGICLCTTTGKILHAHVDELQLRRAPVVAHNGPRLGRTCTTCIPETSMTSFKNCNWGICGRKDHGDVPLRHEGNVDNHDELQLRKNTVFCSLNQTRHVTVPLVRTGHDAELAAGLPTRHRGLNTRGTQREVQNTSKTSLAHATARKERVTVLLVHTGHEHRGPVNDNREHSARRSTSTTSPADATARVDDERRRLSSGTIPTMVPGSLGLPT